jgi:hypothetical protein
MSITLQGTSAFEPEFVGQLSRLSRALLDAGFDPATVAIDKHRASNAAGIGSDRFNYRVRADGANFTITANDDGGFLDRLLTRIHDDAHPNATLAQQPGLFARVTRWMTR